MANLGPFLPPTEASSNNDPTNQHWNPNGGAPNDGSPDNTDWVTIAQQDGTRQSYAKAFLQALGAPLSVGNIALLESIMQNEGTSARYNPMASTWQAPGATSFNSVGVRNYADVASAIAAQVTQWNRVFPRIVAGLMSDNAASVLGDSEWNSYSGNSSGSYQAKLAANYRRFSGDPNAGTGLIGTTGGGGGGAGGAGGGGGANDPNLSQYAFLTSDPQVGPLLQQLAGGSISDQTFIADLQNTPWWRSHSNSARQWQQLQSTDAASYNQQLGEYSRQIVEQAQQLGVGLDIHTIFNLANQWGVNNWQPQDVTNAILGFSSAAHTSGSLAYGMDQVRQMAQSYGVSLNDQQAYAAEVSIAKNQQTMNGLQAGYANQAKLLYPHLGDQLDQGYTLTQIAQPYINTAASTLEIDPSSVDLSQPKWSRALSFHDGKNVRQMTNYEWTQTLMQDPTYGYRFTQGANQARVGLEQSLDKTFGVGVTA